MVTVLEILVFVGLAALINLLTVFIGFRWAKTRLITPLTNQLHTIPARIGSQIGKSIETATEGLDLGAITGALGAGGDTSGGLGALTGLLGGSSGGIGDLLGLLGQFSGKKSTSKGGKMGL